MSSHNASQAPEDAAVVLPQASPPGLPIPSDVSPSAKPYHATTVWGKRGMTLQELTRAFDAFNEDEERLALRFAGSEVRSLYVLFNALFGWELMWRTRPRTGTGSLPSL